MHVCNSNSIYMHTSIPVIKESEAITLRQVVGAGGGGHLRAAGERKGGCESERLN